MSPSAAAKLDKRGVRDAPVDRRLSSGRCGAREADGSGEEPRPVRGGHAATLRPGCAVHIGRSPYLDLTHRASTSVDMTDPLLWLDGDPTDGRRVRQYEPEAPPTPPRSAAPPPPAPKQRGHFRAALAGGFVSAALVTGGAFAFGVVDTDGNPAAVNSGPALVGAKQTGDVAAIYAAARESVVSIQTRGGSGTGFVVERRRHDRHQRARRRQRDHRPGAVRRRRDRDRPRRRASIAPPTSRS